MHATSSTWKHHSEVLQIFPINWTPQLRQQDLSRMVSIIQEKCRKTHPKHKPGCSRPLPLFYNSFILTSLHWNKSSSWWRLPPEHRISPENNMQCCVLFSVCSQRTTLCRLWGCGSGAQQLTGCAQFRHTSGQGDQRYSTLMKAPVLATTHFNLDLKTKLLLCKHTARF